MSVRIVPYAPEHFESMRRFAERTWQRPRSDAFYRWRYHEAPDTRAFLALRDDECLATCFAFRRPYRLGDEIVPFLETFDWHALLELRNVGLGIRIIQRFMAEPEPLILVGGSDDARELLRRLKWEHVGEVKNYALQLRAGLAGAIARRLPIPERGARLLAAAAGLVARRSPSAPPGGRVIPVAIAGPEVEALCRGPSAYGMLAIWTEARLRWLVSGFAGAGHFVPLYFARGADLVGFALLRIYANEGRCGAELNRRAVPERRSRRLRLDGRGGRAPRGPLRRGRARASSTCPVVCAALERNRFRYAGTSPVHVWIPGRAGVPTPILLGSNTRDHGAEPVLPAEWWGDRSTR
jgi:hypothetical protein